MSTNKHKHNEIECDCHDHSHEYEECHDDNCCCGHEHKENRTVIYLRMAVSAVLLILGKVLPLDETILLFLFIPAYIIIGYDILWSAVKGIFKGNFFNENVLMSIATIGAFFVGEFEESVAVMLFYQIGEACSHYAVEKSRKSIGALMDINPHYSNLVTENGVEKVLPNEIKVGDVIAVYTGERIPNDGIIIDGSCTVDNKAVTGESMPVYLETGDRLLSGGINIKGTVKIQVDTVYSESTVQKIIKLVHEANKKKAQSEKFITKFARYYTPVVILCAVIIAGVIPLFAGNFSDWFYKGLEFLVVSCPCALVLSVPLSFFASMGKAAKNGVLIKGGNYLQALNNIDTLIFDKTGTLTNGDFEISEIMPVEISKDELLSICAHAQFGSTHPIAKSILSAYKGEINTALITSCEEIAGKGIKAVIDNKTVYAGNASLMAEAGVDFVEADSDDTAVYIAKDSKYLGYITIADAVRPDSLETIKALGKYRVKNVAMLTGDKEKSAETVAKKLGIKNVYSNLLPQDKVRILQEIKSKAKKGSVCFVGDGINDAPVLAAADVGIALGMSCSDSAVEAADIVIMEDNSTKIITAIKAGRKVMNIVTQNIAFCLLVKFTVLLLIFFGVVDMWLAVLADVGVTLIAVLNSMR